MEPDDPLIDILNVTWFLTWFGSVAQMVLYGSFGIRRRGQGTDELVSWLSTPGAGYTTKRRRTAEYWQCNKRYRKRTVLAAAIPRLRVSGMHDLSCYRYTMVPNASCIHDFANGGAFAKRIQELCRCLCHHHGATSFRSPGYSTFSYSQNCNQGYIWFHCSNKMLSQLSSHDIQLFKTSNIFKIGHLTVENEQYLERLNPRSRFLTILQWPKNQRWLYT